jgi:hypothetical protein
MAHLAQINEENVVVKVLVVPESVSEETAQEFGSKFGEGRWVLTSYNGSFRRAYAGIGSVYRGELDAFQPARPFKGWVFNDTAWDWEAPVPMPTDTGWWGWNEDIEAWESLSDS